jgi:N-acetylneuraminate synthase
LKLLCDETKIAWQAMGQAGYEIRVAEQENRRFRRSLYFVKDLKQGEIISAQHVRRIRPGYGLSPKHYNQVIGSKSSKNIIRGTAVSWNLIEKVSD